MIGMEDSRKSDTLELRELGGYIHICVAIAFGFSFIGLTCFLHIKSPWSISALGDELVVVFSPIRVRCLTTAVDPPPPLKGKG